MRGSGATVSTELNLTDRIACLWAAFSCWSLSVTFYIGWLWTSRIDGGAWVGVPVGAFIVELGLLLSTFFLIVSAQTSSSWLGAAAGSFLVFISYAVGIGALAFFYKSWWVLSYGLWELAGRAIGLARRSEFDIATATTRMKSGFLIFLALCVLMFVLAPRLPAGGVSTELIAKYCPGTRACGMSGPLQNAHAFMVAYFFLLGVVEILPLLARPRVKR